MSTNSTDDHFFCCEDGCRACVHAAYLRKTRKSTGARSHSTARTASFRPGLRGTWRRDRQNIRFWIYRVGARARARTRKGPHK